MWYLINVNNGVVASASTKEDLSIYWTQCKRSYKIDEKYVYEVRMGVDGRTHYLYNSRKQAEEDGFAFAIKVYEEGGEECDERLCSYNLYGYCSKEPPVKEDEMCFEI